MQKVSSFRTASNIIFGINAVHSVPGAVKELNGSRALILTDPGVMEAGMPSAVKEILVGAGIQAEIYPEVEPEPSIPSFEKCLDMARAGGFNVIIGVGGGSSMDMCKLVSIMMTNGGKVQDYFGVDLVKKPGLPKIAIPTTSGTGSEVTKIGILTDLEKELKIGVVTPYNLPDVAIVDPALTAKMPPKITASTGMDALTHAIEAYTSLGADLVSDLLAEKAIFLISSSLRTAVADGQDLEARYNMSMGSLLAGISFANAGVTAVHALAFPLGGMFKIPHGVANAVMLPYVMEFNYMARLDKFARIAELMGGKVDRLTDREAALKAIDYVKELSSDIEMPLGLKELGIPETALQQLSEGASTVTRLLVNNPRTIGLKEITAIYAKSFLN